MQVTDKVIAEIAQYVKPEDLPGDLAEAADFIGVHKCLLLAAKAHGSPYVGTWTNDSSKWTIHIRLIVDVIGMDDARVLVTNFRNTHIVIPKCDSFWRAWMYRIIVELDEDRAVIARRFNITERWVYQIRRNKKQSKNQIDLFG